MQFVRIKPPAPDAAALVAPIPMELPKTVPVVPPAAVPLAQAPSVLPPTGAATTGPAGSGAGTSGSAGAGPGSGGGVGSGVGTGTGSANGPGTGGGPGSSFPPTPTQFFLPPLPAPSSLRGYHLTAYFDVDEKGKSTLLGFNPSRDGGYNRRLREVLLALRFRPGVKADGTPIRDTVDIQFIF
ncbi:MAG: hypothetical protein WKF55_09055 [Gemmatimonadaceae bacterium]